MFKVGAMYVIDEINSKLTEMQSELSQDAYEALDEFMVRLRESVNEAAEQSGEDECAVLREGLRLASNRGAEQAEEIERLRKDLKTAADTCTRVAAERDEAETMLAERDARIEAWEFFGRALGCIDFCDDCEEKNKVFIDLSAKRAKAILDTTPNPPASKPCPTCEAVRDWTERESFKSERYARSSEYATARKEVCALLDAEGGER